MCGMGNINMFFGIYLGPEDKVQLCGHAVPDVPAQTNVIPTFNMGKAEAE